MGLDNENDQVDDEARKEKGRVEADLMREALGRKSDIRLERGSKPYKAIFIADEKKKKEEESRTRETLKRAQEALEEHLRALDEELERLRKSLRDLDELEDLIKAGKFDKNDSHHQELLRSTGMSVDDVQAPDALTKIEEARKKLLEHMKEVERQKNESERLLNDFKSGKISQEDAREFEKNVETLREKRVEILALRKTDDALVQESSVAAFKFDKSGEAFVKGAILGGTNLGEESPELSFDSPVSFAKGLDGNAFKVAGLSDNFAKQVKGESLSEPHKTIDMTLPDLQTSVPKNG